LKLRLYVPPLIGSSGGGLYTTTALSGAVEIPAYILPLIGSSGGGLYTTTALSGAVEIPAYILTNFLLRDK